MSLGPPRPTIGPPLKGTTGSAVPCVSSTATGRDGAHPTFTPRVPATGAMAAKTSARSQASRFDHERTRRYPGGEHVAGIDAEVGDQLGDQSRDEPHVIDSLLVGHRSTTAIGPAEVDAVGVHHDEPVRIGDGVVVRIPLPTGADHPGTVQIHDEPRGMLETRRHVKAVCAGQSPEVKPPWLACPGTPGSAPGKARAHTKGRQRQMTTTSKSHPRTCHRRYCTATTTGALN